MDNDFLAQNNLERAIEHKKCVYPDELKVSNRRFQSGLLKRQGTKMSKHLAKLKFLTYDKFLEKKDSKMVGLYDEIVAKRR